MFHNGQIDRRNNTDLSEVLLDNNYESDQQECHILYARKLS